MDNKVINQLHMREMNLNEVLKIIREEESLTRRKLQDLTGFSWGGVSQIVTRLLSQNLIIEVKDTSPGPGRKPTCLQINGEENLLLGVDINSSGITAVIQNPIKALWFVLFVLVLQQVDGNIIGPKILGNTTGLSSFWVLFAILLFGGLWGFAGMIVGVPLFAVIYDVIKKLVIYGLRRNEELDMLNTYHDNFGDPEDDPPAPEAPAQAPSVDKT